MRFIKSLSLSLYAVKIIDNTEISLLSLTLYVIFYYMYLIFYSYFLNLITLSTFLNYLLWASELVQTMLTRVNDIFITLILKFLQLYMKTSLTTLRYVTVFLILYYSDYSSLITFKILFLLCFIQKITCSIFFIISIRVLFIS